MHSNFLKTHEALNILQGRSLVTKSTHFIDFGTITMLDKNKMTQN